MRDLVAHLAQVEIFDAVWSTVPADRPATVGMRIASLGEGRERAVADLALRLSRELDPAGEPSMASKLPKRWDVDPRLLPAQAPYPPPVAWRGPGAARRPRAGERRPRRAVPKLLSRRLEAYNEGVRTVIGELEDRPAELSRLLREAQRPREGGARDRPDRGREAGRGARRPRVRRRAGQARAGGRRSRVAGRRAARERRGAAGGRACRSRCSRTGCGPMRAAWSRRARPRRRSGSSTPIDRGLGSRPTSTARRRSPTRPRGSLSTLWGSRRARIAGVAGRADGAGRCAGRRPRRRVDAPDPGLRPVWEVPRGLHWYVGARAWRSPWRWLMGALAILLLGLVIGQIYANLTGNLRAQGGRPARPGRPAPRLPDDRHAPGDGLRGLPAARLRGRPRAASLGLAVPVRRRPRARQHDRRRGAGRRDRRGRPVRRPPRLRAHGPGRRGHPRARVPAGVRGLRAGSATGSAASIRPRPATTCPACHRTASWSRRSSSSRWPGPTPAASTASTRCT